MAQQVQAGDPMFILYVHDMDRAVAFYQQVLGLKILQHTPGWSMLRVGGATLALHILGPKSAEAPAAHAGLSLQVEELDDGIAAVVAAGGGHIVTREPDGFVPVRMCELKDPEGNVFELRQFVSDGEDFTQVAESES